MVVHWRINDESGLATASGTFHCDFLAQVGSKLVLELERQLNIRAVDAWRSITIEIERR